MSDREEPLQRAREPLLYSHRTASLCTCLSTGPARAGPWKASENHRRRPCRSAGSEPAVPITPSAGPLGWRAADVLGFTPSSYPPVPLAQGSQADGLIGHRRKNRPRNFAVARATLAQRSTPMQPQGSDHPRGFPAGRASSPDPPANRYYSRISPPARKSRWIDGASPPRVPAPEGPAGPKQSLSGSGGVPRAPPPDVGR